MNGMAKNLSKLEYHIGDTSRLGHNIEGEFLSLEKPKWFTTQPLITHNEAKSVSSLYGYEEVSLPIMEKSEVFPHSGCRKISDFSSFVMYRNFGTNMR